MIWFDFDSFTFVWIPKVALELCFILSMFIVTVLTKLKDLDF